MTTEDQLDMSLDAMIDQRKVIPQQGAPAQQGGQWDQSVGVARNNQAGRQNRRNNMNPYPKQGGGGGHDDTGR